MKNEIATNSTEIAQKLNDSVASVIGTDKLMGFEKAFLISNAIGELKTLLTPVYMAPIMQLQGNKLGFKTDKDKDGGYAESVVKNCLIEAVLYGLQPFGNQFNIIAGNMYATKEGVGYLLSNFKGLSYDIVAELPRIKEGSAAVVMIIEWSLSGAEKNVKKIDIPIKVNQYMGADAVLGKAMRKARKWLYDTITGSEIPDGDIEFSDAKVVASSFKEEIIFEDLEMLFEMKKVALTPEETTNAKRILDDKETASYKKLFTLLQSK